MGSFLIKALDRLGVVGALQSRWRVDLNDRFNRLRLASKAQQIASKAQQAALQDRLKDARHASLNRDRLLRKDTKRLTEIVEHQAAELGSLRESLGQVQRELRIVQAAAELGEQLDEWIPRLGAVLDATRVVDHVRRVVESATLDTDPFPHLVLHDLMPADLYELLLACLPPEEFFPDRDRVKLNLRPGGFARLPKVARAAWDFFETHVPPTVAAGIQIRMGNHVAARFDDLLGPPFSEQVMALPQVASGSRLMLRRSGYRLAPHLDPKRASATVLCYFAKPGDPEDLGTRLYECLQPVRQPKTATYYPGEDGIPCEERRHIPFRSNTAVAFLNAGGAHGFDVPAGTEASFRRYSYQFYVGPDLDAFLRLLGQLPDHLQQEWRGLLLEDDARA